MKFKNVYILCPYYRKKLDRNFCLKCCKDWKNPCEFPKPYLEFLWENPHEDFVEKKDFSVTSILRCPVQIYLFNQYGYIINPKESSMSVLGKLNHFAFETVLKKDEEDKKKFIVEKLFCLSFYLDKTKNVIVRLCGKPDLIINNNKNLTIIDWKNTFYINYSPFKKHLFQLYTYAFIIETLYKKKGVNVEKGIIYYLGEYFKKVEINFTESKKKLFFPILFKWIKFRINLLYELLNNKINFSDKRLMPSPSDCFYCPVSEACRSPFKRKNIADSKFKGKSVEYVEGILLEGLKRGVIF